MGDQDTVELAEFNTQNPNPVLRVARDGTILYANSASLPLLNSWKCDIGQALPQYWREFAAYALDSSSIRNQEIKCEDRLFSLTFAPVTNGNYANIYGFDITGRRWVEEALRERGRDLGERVKELRCLYHALELVSTPDISLEEIFEGMVDIAHSAWQYPEITAVRFVLDGKGALSPQTVKHHHVTLHTALESAVKWGLLSRNPADAIDLPRCQRIEWHILSEHDIQTVLEAAKKTPYYALFYLALFTGMRRSERLALRWSDIDLLLCQVYVTRTLHQLRDSSIVYRAPKTAKGRRMIALSPSTAFTLREHKEKQELECAILGISLKDDGLVFSQLDGRPLLPNTVTHNWIKLVRQLGLDGIRLHDARHSHASLMLKQGVHPKIVQERLGHASIQVTLDTYSHVAPGLQEAAANGFDEFVFSIRNKAIS